MAVFFFDDYERPIPHRLEGMRAVEWLRSRSAKRALQTAQEGLRFLEGLGHRGETIRSLLIGSAPNSAAAEIKSALDLAGGSPLSGRILSAHECLEILDALSGLEGWAASK